jgi:nucleoid DNA-binding protein
MIKNKTITQKALKEAYDLVIADLFNSFAKMKANQSIRLNRIGTFEKKKKQITSRLQQARGKTYQYYQITFRMSQTLKKELDK